LILDLDQRGPKYLQLTRAMRAAIQDGALKPGERVPASRDLARQLMWSRNLVILAYEQLLAEGYLVSTSRAGTFVSAHLPTARSSQSRGSAGSEATPGLSDSGRRLSDAARDARQISRWPRTCGIDFMIGISTPDARVTGQLRQAFARAIRDRATFYYPNPAGDEGLRAEIAARLVASRGIRRTRDQVVITNGAQQALDICARLLLGPGDAVVVEDPGYEAARAAFVAAGATVIPVPVDDEGLNPDRLPRRARRVRLIYVTPSHQFPTGAVLSESRRHAVLEWAGSHGAYVLEDDYDGELRYTGRPLKALTGLPCGGRVIYCGTFAKALFPSVRLGYLALPDSITTAAIDAKWVSDRGSSTLIQRLVREFMAAGDYDRHIRRMHRRYAARRAAIAKALVDQLGDEVRIAGDAGGLHLVAWLPRLSAADVDVLIDACEKRDVGVYSIARHAIAPLPCGGLLLGYGLVEEGVIETGVRRLASAYRQLLRQKTTSAIGERA
jgi:GntR family transcriptional regulator/MocR family aminotransferase